MSALLMGFAVGGGGGDLCSVDGLGGRSLFIARGAGGPAGISGFGLRAGAGRCRRIFIDEESGVSVVGRIGFGGVAGLRAAIV